MASLRGRVAVITGAASGIGLALATRAAAEGMRVVMADIEEDALAAAAVSVSETGAEVLAVVTDVSVWTSVQDLAAAAEAAFDPVWLVCNNAGVAAGALSWQTALSSWEWTVGVNLWGVIHGIAAFVPGLVARGEGHVVNTASMSGLLSSPGLAMYCATKHAVVAITECLYRELALTGSGVGVSLLCPGSVRTRIVDAERNWPTRLGPLPSLERSPLFEMVEMVEQLIRDRVAAGMPAANVADRVFDAVSQQQFWVLTNPDEYAEPLRQRCADAIEGQNPDPFDFR